MDAFSYSFSEFLDHCRAMTVVRNYEFVHPGGPNSTKAIYVGSDQSAESMVIRQLDYFQQQYPNRREAIYKQVRFMMSLGFAMTHLEMFDSHRLAFRDLDPSDPCYVSEAVLHAVHSVFCVPEPPKESEADADFILSSALQYAAAAETTSS